ncbi:MAG: amidohydrolase family protein [Desulfobacterales bacterium]|nr:amidohydrolase family protein [Desulfobacterales bacterium]
MKCIFGETIYTGKLVVSNRYLVFDGTRIVGLSKTAKGDLAGEFNVITPAFIDAHSHIGLARSGEPSGEGEANDQFDSILTLTDALDSVQMDDKAFKDAVESGVLYSCVVPGSGNIIGGQSAVIRNFGRDSSAALIGRAGLKAAFGYNPMSTRRWKGQRPTTRMGAVSILRGKLDEVRRKDRRWREAKGAKKADISFTAEDDVLRDLLSGKLRLRAHVHKIDDIAALLRLADDFKLSLTVEHAMDVHQIEIFMKLKKRKIPVVYGPVDSFAYKVELKHEDWRNIRHLIASGVDFGLMTDHPVTLARQLFLQTRWFVRSGMSKQAAIELVSRRNARILGIDRQLGTLARGKWASFVCWSGDPFSMVNFPQAVYGEGELLYSD